MQTDLIDTTTSDGESETAPEINKAIRSVAIFEAVKGLLVLAVGLGLLGLIHRDLETVGDHIIHFLRLNPAHHYPQIFLKALSHVTDRNLLWLALGAALYSAMRFAEAYGLWFGYPWAEWLAIVSGGLYLPVEFHELSRHFSWLKLAITLGNILIVLYLLRVRWSAWPHGSSHSAKSRQKVLPQSK